MLDILRYSVLAPIWIFLNTTLGSTLLFWAPSLIGAYRKWTGSPILGSKLWMVIVPNAVIVGWPLALCHAFNLNPVWWTMSRLGLVQAGGSPVAPAPVAPYAAGSPVSAPRVVPCGQCQSGSMTCSSCGGRGSWYDQPQGATGVAQLRSCPACASSGRIRCTYCGGTGQITI